MCELKNEVEIFYRRNSLYVQFYNIEFVVMLAYLANVFDHLNDMNLSLQGRDVTVSNVINIYLRDGVVVRASALQSVDLGFIP